MGRGGIILEGARRCQHFASSNNQGLPDSSPHSWNTPVGADRYGWMSGCCGSACQGIKLECACERREKDSEMETNMPPLWFSNPALSALTAECAASLWKAAEESHRDPIRDTSSALHCRPEPHIPMKVFQVYVEFTTETPSWPVCCLLASHS